MSLLNSFQLWLSYDPRGLLVEMGFVVAGSKPQVLFPLQFLVFLGSVDLFELRRQKKKPLLKKENLVRLNEEAALDLDCMQ